MSNGTHLMVAALAALALAGGLARRPAVAPAPAVEPVVAAPKPVPPSIGNGLASLTLKRAPDGRFYADALVNGAAVRFLIDTGASGVALTEEDARRAGLGAGDFSATGIGAGGRVALRPVTLARLAIGPLAADHVPAMVARELPVSLLGQSFLSRLGAIEIKGDAMALR